MVELSDYDNVMRSCGMLYFHFSWGLFLMALGIGTIISRLRVEWIKQYLRPWHSTLGQSWMYGTIVQMATSLYCRADGFKPLIFGFLVILVVNMIVGHASIRVYQRGVTSKALTHGTSSHLPSATQSLQIAHDNHPTTSNSETTVCGIKLIRFKQLHGVCMCLAYSMLFGAGVMFIKRSKQLANCQPFYAKGHADVVSVGSVIFELDGALILGGHNFTKPLMMLQSDL